MRREDEYRQLANSVRERAGDEESAESAVGNFGGYLRASSRSTPKTRQPKKIDDTGTHYDPLDRSRTVWPASPT